MFGANARHQRQAGAVEQANGQFGGQRRGLAWRHDDLGHARTAHPVGVETGKLTDPLDALGLQRAQCLIDAELPRQQALQDLFHPD